MPTLGENAKYRGPRSFGGAESLALHEELELRAGAALAGIAQVCPDDGTSPRPLLRSIIHANAMVVCQAEEFAGMRLLRYLQAVGQLTARVVRSPPRLYDLGGNPVPLPKAPSFATANRFQAAHGGGDPLGAIAAADALRSSDVHFAEAWIDRSSASGLRLP